MKQGIPVVNVKILGISGTPIKGGNCDALVQLALEAAREVGDVETEFITLADKKIAPCKHCQWCIEHRARCNVKDDLLGVHDRMYLADGLILGGPTYHGILSPQLQFVFNRGREEVFFAHRMYNRVGGAITLGWFSTEGEANNIISRLMNSFGFIPVARGSAVTSTAWRGVRAEYQEHGVLDDAKGTRSVRAVGRRVAEAAKMMKYARDAGLGGHHPRAKGVEKVFVGGVWRDKE